MDSCASFSSDFHRVKKYTVTHSFMFVCILYVFDNISSEVNRHFSLIAVVFM